MPYPYAIGSAGLYPEGPDMGKPIKRGTALYKWLIRNDAGVFSLGMWKSTDDGVTWSEQDAGNGPAANLANGSPWEHDTGAELVYTTMSPGSGAVTSSLVTEFDPSTDTWGTPLTGPVVPAVTGTVVNTRKQAHTIKRSNGNLVFIATYVYGARVGIEAYVYSSGAWGSFIDLLAQSLNGEEATPLDYCLIGGALGASDLVHVFAHTGYGEAYVTLNTSGTVANYHRQGYDVRTQDAGGPRYSTTWGKPTPLALGSVSSIILPAALKTPSESSWNLYHPCLWVYPDTGTNTYGAMQRQAQTFRWAHNACSVSVCGDGESIVMVWADIDGSSGDADVKAASWKGFGWSAPTTIFSTTWSGEGMPENLEAEFSGNVLRVVFWGEGDVGTDYTWYWQGAYTPSATGCTGGSGNINSVR